MAILTSSSRGAFTGAHVASVSGEHSSCASTCAAHFTPATSAASYNNDVILHITGLVLRKMDRCCETCGRSVANRVQTALITGASSMLETESKELTHAPTYESRSLSFPAASSVSVSASMVATSALDVGAVEAMCRLLSS